ncbi:hypothetical protein Z043_109277, partial [Scleropages formosus]
SRASWHSRHSGDSVARRYGLERPAATLRRWATCRTSRTGVICRPCSRPPCATREFPVTPCLPPSIVFWQEDETESEEHESDGPLPDLGHCNSVRAGSVDSRITPTSVFINDQGCKLVSHVPPC